MFPSPHSHVPLPALPPLVAAYVEATNSFDLEGLLVLFTDDALVNDQLRDHWGKQAIKNGPRGACPVPLEAGTDARGTAVRSSRDYGRDPANRGACIMTLLPRGVKVHLAFGFTRRWFTAPFR
jgi:hypothetical protein